MKLKYTFARRNIMGENIFIPLGEGALKVSGIAYTNETAAVIMERLKEDRTEEELVNAVTEEFDIDEESARKDVAAFIRQLRELKLLEE